MVKHTQTIRRQIIKLYLMMSRLMEIQFKTPTLCRVMEVVHLTFPPHIFSVRAKFGACYITAQRGRV